MQLSAFGELVAIRTKLAGLGPFVIGAMFAAVHFHSFNWLNTVIFFVAMLMVELATTGVGNLVAYQRVQDDPGKRAQTVIGRRGLSLIPVQSLLLIMLTVATCLGIWLVWRTNILLLLLGVIGFAVALFYTVGPVPLSRLPLSEVFIGGTLGLLIPFVAIYVNVPASQLLTIMIHWPGALLLGDLWRLIGIVLLCLPLMAVTANVTLADNISRLSQRKSDDKHTLPEYLGERWSLYLYHGLLICGYIGILIGIALGMIPWPALVILLSIPAVYLNNRHFQQQANKTRTLKPAISNLLWVTGTLFLGLAIEMVVG